MKVNTKIMTAALLPLYGYLAICVYVFFQSHYDFDKINLVKILLVIILLLIAGVLSALQNKSCHLVSLVLYLSVGIIGIRSGLLVEPMNWMELIASAFVVAYAIALYEIVEHHREIWHEED